jgi:hypothetical protein
LLHPDFAERGQSGRWWTRDATLDGLPDEAKTFDPPEVRDAHADEVADGVVLVTYVAVRGESPWSLVAVVGTRGPHADPLASRHPTPHRRSLRSALIIDGSRRGWATREQDRLRPSCAFSITPSACGSSR